MNPELAALQEVIEDLHQLMTVMSDPKHTQVASKCLTALTQIQTEMMQSQGGGPQDALMAQLQGAGAGGQPPQY